MDYKTAQTLVAAYTAVERLNDALTKLATADPSAHDFRIEFVLGIPKGQWSHDVVVDAKHFREDQRKTFAIFLLGAERRRLSEARAAHVRTINQIGGVEPPPHPFAI